MFETIDGTEIDLPLLADDRSRHWSFVRQHLFMPWFYMTYRYEAEEDFKLSEMLCLTQIRDLLEATRSEQLEVIEVNVMLPGHMTGKGRWTMEPLAEIWVGEEPEAAGQEAYVYVTASGARYLGTSLCDHPDELKNLELLYKWVS